MNAVACPTQNLRAFLDMDVERELIEHDLTRMLRVAGRYTDFNGNVLSGKRLREEIESFLIDNWEIQHVQLREV